MKRPTADTVLANLVQFLIDGSELDAANILMSCNFEYYPNPEMIELYLPDVWAVYLSCPRSSYDALMNQELPYMKQIDKACEAVFASFGASVEKIELGAVLIDIDPDWRTELLEIARGQSINNQIGDGNRAVKLWNNLRFRSVSEIRVAQALDRANVLFLPNCKARLSSTEGRVNKEADFLICQNGKWGILEVDGEPFHPPSRTTQDHERDRLFRTYGVRVVEHFDAEECFENAKGVVDKFLSILEKS